jgi:PPK2 family polyphosphate:nucleotide phosphotransferase
LQELLYGAAHQSVLIILQGLDTSGKDGTIKHVMSQINPIGCHAWAFKVPTAEELSHDFLWRVHQRTPARGMFAIFNRSHYEDVLVVRVHNLVPEDVWRKRYEQINHFEHLLAQNDTIICKFFLHISKDEQKRRLLAREQNPDKSWKLSLADWQERAYWDAYQEAYADALGRCGTPWAPWQIIPANKKWYRNFAIARALVERLTPYQQRWQQELRERGKAELEKIRADHVHDD